MTQNVTPSLQKTIHRTVLDNGMVVIAVENPAADIIAARIFINAGSSWESPTQAGLSHLLSAVLTKGTEGRSSLEIAELVESVGATLSTDTTPDYFLLSLKTVSGDFPELLRLSHELLRSPTFPESEVELERRLTLQGIRSQQEQPFTIGYDQMRRAMYPDHPYACSVLGTEATVSQLTRLDLQTYHQTYFRPDRIVISLTGRISPLEATALVESVFGDWQAPAVSVPPLELPRLKPNPRFLSSIQDTQQSIVMAGYLGPSVLGNDPLNPNPRDYAILKLLNTYLGNGLSSRLFVELREKRGLAYDVSAFYPTRLREAAFVVYMGTAHENTAIALKCLQTEVERLSKTTLLEDELQSAKNKLLGQYALGKQTNAQIAQVFGWYEILGLGIDFDTRFTDEVAGISPEEAQEAAGRYLTQAYISLVGPSEAIAPLCESVTY